MSIEMELPLEEIDRVASYLVENLAPHTLLFLIGDLASGKTTLTQAIAQKRGVTSAVTSPTFSLQQIYGTDLFHYDLYRISSDEFFSLGLHEELDREGWHLIEWGDLALKRFLSNAGYNIVSISITPTNKGRNYSIEV